MAHLERSDRATGNSVWFMVDSTEQRHYVGAEALWYEMAYQLGRAQSPAPDLSVVQERLGDWLHHHDECVMCAPGLHPEYQCSCGLYQAIAALPQQSARREGEKEDCGE